MESRNPYNYCNLRKIIYHQYLPMLIGIFDQKGAQSDRLRYWNNTATGTNWPSRWVTTVLTVYDIETLDNPRPYDELRCVCNSTYRLRYAPKGARQQRSKATMRSAHLKYLNEEKVKRRWSRNSPYRLRYWNQNTPTAVLPVASELQQCLPFTVLKRLRLNAYHIMDFTVATVLTVYGIETLKTY